MLPGVALRSPSVPSRALAEQLFSRWVEPRSIAPAEAPHRHPKERGHLGQRDTSGFAKPFEDRHSIHLPRVYADPPRQGVPGGTPPLRSNSTPLVAERHASFMLSGIIVAVLKEQFADHIVLSDERSLPLAEGLVINQFGSGTRILLAYSRDGGGGDEIVVQSIKRG
jgi:hypothetical protein